MMLLAFPGLLWSMCLCDSVMFVKIYRYNNDGFICISARMLDFTISASGGYRGAGQWCIGGYTRVYAVHQPPGFLTAYTHLTDHK